MPDLLGPTNPVPGSGYDTQTTRISPQIPGDTVTQNLVDPSRVTRADNRSERQDNNDSAGSQTARFESNFMTFLQRLRTSQGLPDTFMQVMQYQGTRVSSGIDSGFAAEMSRFMEFMRMDEKELMEFLRGQMESGTRFTGALFDALRAAFSQSQSELLKNEILQFLRRFSDFSSTGHLEEKMLHTVANIADALPGKWSDQAEDILARLQNGVAAGDRQGNLNLLRAQLFTMVSRYVSATHDHGVARGLLSMLALDVARYENGSESGLLQSLRNLAASGALPGGMEQLNDAELLNMLTSTEYFKAAQSNAFASHLSELTDRALRGEGGVDTRDAFHNILNSILINESVYMPLQHLMLPLNWNGNLMFSEMWVDPDADKKQGQSGNGGGKTMRILIKMDVESLGAFDLLIQSRPEGVSLNVSCPAEVSAHAGDVSAALGTILRRNGFNVEAMDVHEMKRPLTISEVFPKIFERMRGLNVKA